MRKLTLIASCSLMACAALGIDPAEFDYQPPPTPIPADTTVRLANGTWVSPEGTRMRFAMVVPAMRPGDKLPLVLALHGQAPTRDTVPPFFGQRSLESLFGPALRPLGAIIVAPDAPRNNWTDPTAERAILAFMDEMKSRYPIDTMRTLVTGISMGGMGSWFLANRHPTLFRAAVPLTSFPLVRHTPINRTGLSAAFDEMVRDSSGAWTAPYRAVPVYAIHSRQDESVPFAAESTLVAMINARGGQVHFVAVDSLKHGPAIAYQGALRSSVYWIRRQWERR
ncbi:MAG TPA: prolyl oligopeptidase family serine peptidase [Gemmatimonadaceae bacterium]